jgi:sec-independent protein translocase protein TatB
LVSFGLISFGITELLVIAVLVIVFVGPDRLPEMMRFVGKQYGRLRRASDELRRAFQLEVDRVDADSRAKEIRKRREELMARRRTEREAKADGPVARGDELDTTPPPEDEDPGGLAAQALADAGVEATPAEASPQEPAELDQPDSAFPVDDDPPTEDVPSREPSP